MIMIIIRIMPRYTLLYLLYRMTKKKTETEVFFLTVVVFFKFYSTEIRYAAANGVEGSIVAASFRSSVLEIRSVFAGGRVTELKKSLKIISNLSEAVRQTRKVNRARAEFTDRPVIVNIRSKFFFKKKKSIKNTSKTYYNRISPDRGRFILAIKVSILYLRTFHNYHLSYNSTTTHLSG